MSALRTNGAALPGANGDAVLVDAFAEAWVDGTPQRGEVAMRIRLYALESLTTPPHPPYGRASAATEDDVELGCAPWVCSAAGHG